MATLFFLFCTFYSLITYPSIPPMGTLVSPQKFKPYHTWWKTVPTVGLERHTALRCCYYFRPHFFLLHDLAPHQGRKSTIALYDTPVARLYEQAPSWYASLPELDHAVRYTHSFRKIKNFPFSLSQTNLIACNRIPIKYLHEHHGTVCAWLITVIAPEADLAVYPLLMEDHTHRFFLEALKISTEHSTTILSMSFSMDNPSILYKELRTLLSQHISCAAAGNTPQSLYPALYPETTIVVGAFGMRQKKDGHFYFPLVPYCKQPTSNFSFYTVAPGQAIAAKTYIKNKKTNTNHHVFMHGTSFSVPFITALYALLYAEFYPILSKNELMKIIHYAGVSLHKNYGWQDLSYGTPDMRFALFMGHVLVELKKSKSFDIDTTLRTLRTILLQEANTYNGKFISGFNYIFEQEMIDFIYHSQEKTPILLSKHSSRLKREVLTVAKKVKDYLITETL